MAEREEEAENKSWTASTNWIVVHGSLQNTVSFESPVEEEEENTSSRPKAALVLKPPTSDSSPCEINVSFTKKHEVRQVYVRSTSRVYEVYYALERQSDQEYLCTVRCGVAAREDDILQTGDTGEATGEDHDTSGTNTPEIPNQTAKSDSINSNGSDEDGWVEVKVPDSPLVTDTIKPMAKEIKQKTSIKVQDYYEATAEITDSYPCVSLTLRLLSLQVKECLSIEEIYIFAEPAVESTDAGHSLAPVESSAGNNLLAMLVPSLLQVSKSGISRVKDGHVSDIREGQKLPGSESKATESISSELHRTVNQETHVNMADTQEVKIQELVKDRTEHRQLESGPHSPHSTNLPKYEEEKKLPVGHLERMLGQLDCRMARIEAFCASFEENMLKPLNCLATRMQRMEHQLDELRVRSESPPRSLPCSRIVAPEFSFDESESNSLHAHSSDENVDSASESEEGIPFDKPSSSNVDATAATSPKVVPHWVVNAPEFSNTDDDSDNNCYDTSDSLRKDIPLDKPSSSIDSALASALASLILSTSAQPMKLSPAFMVKAPDLASEDDENESPSACVSCEDAKNHGIDFHGNHGTEKLIDSDSIPCTSSSQDSEVQPTKESPVKVTAEGAAERKVEMSVVTGVQSWTGTAEGDLNEMERNQVDTSGVQFRIDTAEGDLNEMGQTEDACMEEIANGAVSLNQPRRELYENRDSSSSGIVDQYQTIAECANRNTRDNVEVMPPKQFCAFDINAQATMKGYIGQSYIEWSDDSGGEPVAEGDAVQDGPATSTELQNAGHGMDRLENELKPTSHPVLDFELPILDVKFISEENLHRKWTLEALLGDVLETTTHPSGLDYNYNDEVANGRKDDQDIGEGEENDPLASDPFLELEDLTVESVAPSLQHEELQDPSVYGIEEPFSSLT
ncbi:hypothetical protein MRB53_006915 [Persea americana]|uniref:Uncharacterized protein n=1 Tax=Persea americana TaxID=3435 RepID=A0ACC2MJ47_PERAE|nr:hypothetical protein MRB53_006915 [Persea americana]